MLYHKKRITLLTCLILLFSSISFASSKVEKLAEYSAFDFLVDVVNGSTVTFQGKPALLNLESNASNHLQLQTKQLVNNYTDVHTTQFSLEDIVAPNTEYLLDVKTNNELLYALLTNNDDAIREKKNLLLKSSDGHKWELYKTFPAEWELFNLDVNDNNVSIGCLNCEDDPKLSYIISTDQGKTWQKHNIPGDAESSYFSGIAHDRLFVVTQNRDTEDRKQLITELMFKELKNKKAEWVKSNISDLLTLNKEQHGQVVTLHFQDLEDLYATEEYLIANAKYLNTATNEDETNEISVAWISNDKGNTWKLFNLNNLELEHEGVVQFTKHGGTYHLVTNKNLNTSGFDFDNDGLDPIGMMMEFFKQQQYSYYKLSKEELDNTEKFSVEPTAVLNHGMGFNIDYKHTPKSSYVDAMFIHNDENNLKLEFYRLHD